MDDIGEGNDHFPGGVSASVGVLVAGTDGRPPIEPDPWTQDDTFYVRSSQVIFTTTLERDETVDNFGMYILHCVFLIFTYFLCNSYLN